MHEYEDSLPTRKFDNFQFVHFEHAMLTYRYPSSAFAFSALMKIPDQYKQIEKLGLLNFSDTQLRP
ncbi:hypothetical protein DPMN_135643 [Dreissena polymorpha]|uniref:Copine C-terminal domain-containing protein n=1 Tax=Dreissena polymorpha TaxID=45954 RepID=A0A9D4FYI3_DREPO|nr:hypothetical protein DPMN_135643 [Dreissena polymorpha]